MPTYASVVRGAAVKLTPLRADPRAFVNRARFLLSARRARPLIQSWLATGDVTRGGLLQSLVDRPDMIGIISWPYVHNSWDMRRRFAAVGAHYCELVELPWLRVGVTETRPLIGLGDVLPGLTVVLDRPIWFVREGELTLNLFMGEERVYSVAFSLGRHHGERIAYVGGIQGRNLEGVQSLYRDMTKALHGMRPRDFLIATLQYLCGLADVRVILGIADANRHQRHGYFGQAKHLEQSANYDEIWLDRGGVAVDGGFYRLPLVPGRRSEAEVTPNKRAMYRRRYSLLDRVQKELSSMAAAIDDRS